LAETYYLAEQDRQRKVLEAVESEYNNRLKILKPSLASELVFHRFKHELKKTTQKLQLKS